MEHFIHAQFKTFHLFPLRALPVHHQLQRARRAVRKYCPVIQQIQIQADSRFELRQDSEAHKKVLLLLPRKKAAEHHCRGMLLQHLHISCEITFLRPLYLREGNASPAGSQQYGTAVTVCTQYFSIPCLCLSPVYLHPISPVRPYIQAYIFAAKESGRPYGPVPFPAFCNCPLLTVPLFLSYKNQSEMQCEIPCFFIQFRFYEKNTDFFYSHFYIKAMFFTFCHLPQSTFR